MMRLSKEQSSFFLFLCLLCAAWIFILPTDAQAASDYLSQPEYFYYQQLDTNGKIFYEALDYWNDRQEWLDGILPSVQLSNGTNRISSPLHNTLSQTALADYIQNQSDGLLTSFAQAVNAFSWKHPELFYVDFSRLSFRVIYYSNEDIYMAYMEIDPQYANCYAYALFSSESAVRQALEQMEAKITAICATIPDSAAPEQKIRLAHDALVEQTQFATKEKAEAANRPFLNTMYGALVRGQAIGDGYAFAFQKIMERLQIPCITVQGIAGSVGHSPAVDAASDWGAHRWNEVQLAVNGHLNWFAVDCAWDEHTVYTYLQTSEEEKNSKLLAVTENIVNWYLLQGSQGMASTHLLYDPYRKALSLSPVLSLLSYDEACKN